jgi:ribose 5-phosphate isomerase RpiB
VVLAVSWAVVVVVVVAVSLEVGGVLCALAGDATNAITASEANSSFILLLL